MEIPKVLNELVMNVSIIVNIIRRSENIETDDLMKAIDVFVSRFTRLFVGVYLVLWIIPVKSEDAHKH